MAPVQQVVGLFGVAALFGGVAILAGLSVEGVAVVVLFVGAVLSYRILSWVDRAGDVPRRMYR